MATTNEIDAALRQDPGFLKLQQEDPEKAIKYAEEAYKLAEDKPAKPLTLTPPKSQAKPQEGPVRTYVRPALEGAGNLAGMAVGMPMGPAGVIGAGMIGGAGGSALADVAEIAAGERPAPQNISEMSENLGRNIESGVMMEGFGGAVNLGIKGVQALKAPLKDSIDYTKQRIADLAENMGVKLSPGDITGSHTLAMFIEGIGERTPFSAGQIHKFRMEGLKKLVERRNELLEKGGTAQSIEETGKAIQRRTQDLMDELGVTNETMRKEFINSTLKRIGSDEPFEVLGLSGQDTLKKYLDDESERVTGLYDHAFSKVPPGSRVQPTNLQQTARQKLEEYSRYPQSVQNPKVVGLLEYYSGSGNKLYDEQQRLIAPTLESMPATRWNPKTKAMEPVNQDEMLKTILGDVPIERPGYDPRILNKDSVQLNAAINEVDKGLQKTGDVGVKGMGTGKSSEEYQILTSLKRALKSDFNAFSESFGSNLEFQGAYQLAKAAAGEFKSFAGTPAVRNFLKAQPQEAARILAQSKDLQTIRHMKTVLGPNFQPIEKAFANELLGVGSNAVVTPKFLRNQLDRHKKGVAEAMLGKGKVDKIQLLAKQLEDGEAAAIQNPIFQNILKANPASVVDLVVKPHDTQNLVMFRQMLGPEASKDLARGMVNRLLMKPDFDITETAFMAAGAALSPAKLLSGMKRYGDDTLKELFRHDPTFLKEMKELSEVASASQGAAHAAANPSGTGQSLIAFGEASMMLINPVNGLKVALGIPALTKLYISPIGRKWLTEGFKTSPTSNAAGTVFGKILGIAMADAIADETAPSNINRPQITASAQPSIGQATSLAIQQ